ncbi:phospholipase D family protein [Ruegeria arenilitoris]|uniref:phospholipase D family protein n=1 Tax=Ruegeria arenilitoris TaxID=1173585 RepID=UPI00147B30C9|nr:phospholipase D family protein [Ruegeria arenilitoris]
MPVPQQNDFEVLITAEQAWPALEKAVLEARHQIKASFRIFDFMTRLRSDEARRIGDTWFDLIEHVIRKGVSFHLVISDFDPIFATELHELSWRTKRQAVALGEILGPDLAARLSVRVSMHPAQAGALPWATLLPAVLRKKAQRMQEVSRERRERQAVRLGSDMLPRLHTVSHHQKVAVIDNEVCYLGGLDLNERRFDTPDHDRLAKNTWSDVQLLVRGPEAAEAARHIDRFEQEIATGQPNPQATHLRRTLSSPRRFAFWRLSPKTIAHEIEDEHIAAFQAARQLLHIETQYFRSTRLAEALAEAGHSKQDLKLVLVLPALPEEVAFGGHDGLDAQYGLDLQAKCLQIIQQGFQNRVSVSTPIQPISASGADASAEVLSGSPIIHVHNKVLVVDDSHALVGSANLNGRSLRWDTEVALRITDRQRVTVLRQALADHWWFSDDLRKQIEPDAMFAWWGREVQANGVRRPEARSGFLVPHDADVARDMRQPLPGVTENIV